MAPKIPGMFQIYFFNLFIQFWLRWVFVAARRLSLAGGELGLLFVVVCGLLIAVASLVAEHGLQGTWAQQLWHTGLVAPRHVGSSQTRARTRVPCIGRRICNHCSTREDPELLTSNPNSLVQCLAYHRYSINSS